MPILISLLLALLATLPAFADQAADFAAAEAVFQKAVGGDGAAVDESVRRFDKLAAGDGPPALLYSAYLGAAQAMQGRQAWMPWSKMRATERGLATLDKTLRRLDAAFDRELVRGAPISLEVRLIAASTFLALPSLFNRFDSGKQLLREAFASPAYAAAPGGIKARLHRQAAIAAQHDKNPRDEAAHLKQALEALPAGPIADAARRRLQELGA